MTDEIDPFLDGGPLLPVLEAVSPGVATLASAIFSVSFSLLFKTVAADRTESVRDMLVSPASLGEFAPDNEPFFLREK